MAENILIIGGGPAGMMAAIAAANNSHPANIVLIEKNEKLGKKLHLTGKGRCNITNAADIAGLMAHTVRNPRFLHSAFSKFDAAALMAFIESLGVKLKVERGNRVFPESDRADDINQALSARLGKLGVKVRFRTAAENIQASETHFTVRTAKNTLHAAALILATGGLSYPSTGATGEGFDYARALGHTIMPTYPSLVPLRTQETWVEALEGLSLRNVRLSARLPGGKVLYEETGEMLFTPHGVTGPLVLKASAYITDRLDEKPLLAIDLKPGLTPQQLDARILRDFAERQNQDFANALRQLLPARLIETVAGLCEIPLNTKINAITRNQRQTLAHTLKNLPLTPTGTAGYAEAVITRGGVCTKEINPATLMSKKIPGLFFAGECIDTDALTGGYNLQIAFSTGHLAGLSAAKYILSR